MRQLAQDNIRLEDRQLNKEIAKKMINPYCFTDRNLKVANKINLESHNLHHTNSKFTITHCLPEFGIEFRFNIKIMKELSVIYARLINQNKFKYQTAFFSKI